TGCTCWFVLGDYAEDEQVVAGAVGEALQLGQFFPAGVAPGSPQVDHGGPAQLGERDLTLLVKAGQRDAGENSRGGDASWPGRRASLGGSRRWRARLERRCDRTVH